MSIPKRHYLFNPLLQTMKELGSSATISELDEAVTKRLHLTDKDIAQPHGDSNRTELQYQLAWTRTYLKAYGLLDNSERGIWVLTSGRKEIDSVDPHEVVRHVQELKRSKKSLLTGKSTMLSAEVEVIRASEAFEEETEEETWRGELLTRLRDLSPVAFERLCQRLLRESGFVEVKVTGRSGDGGSDGVGIVRLGGLLGFPILFQCKRYSGSVSSSVIRDFRGAMIGRADRGLVIIPGTFSRDAKIEATRDGAPPIDLLDGEQLLDKLKELRLGVTVKMIEQVSVQAEFFKDL